MRPALMLLAVLSLPALVIAQESSAISPEEAAKKLNQKVTVEMEVKSTGGRDAVFLNSQVSFRDASNFTLFIPRAAIAKFKAAKIDNPAEHFQGQTVQVTGTVTLYQEKPQIRIDDPKQIRVVEKESE